MPEAFQVWANPNWMESGRISVPQRTWDETSLKDARYVRITRTNGGPSNIYKVMLRPSAEGRQIWVSSGQLDLKVNEKGDVQAEAVKKNTYQWNQLLQTGWGRLMLLGLALGLLGLGIDAAFDIGKYQLLFPTSDETAATARGMASLLKSVGLVIVFLQATWFKKD